MPPVAAMHAVQVFSALLFGAIVLLWLRSAGALALAPVLAAVLIVAEFAYAARSNTPDMLASALLLAGLYAHMRRREICDRASCCSLAVMVRPDNVIFVGVLRGAAAGFPAMERRRAGRRGRLVRRLFRDLALGRPSRLVAASLFLEHRAADEHGRLRSGLLDRALRQGFRQRRGALDRLQHLGRRRRAGARRLVRDRPRRLQARPACRHPVCGAGAGGAGQVRGVPDPRQPHLFPQSDPAVPAAGRSRSWRCGLRRRRRRHASPPRT